MEPKNLRHLAVRSYAPAVIFLFLTAAATLLRALAHLLSFDVQIGYFQTGAALLPPLYVLFGLALLFCFAFPFLTHKGQTASPVLTASVEFVGAALCALSFAVCALYLLFFYDAVPAPIALTLAATVLSLLGALYFLLRLRESKSETLAWFGYAAILSCTLILAITYFDRYTQMNAPHKLSVHVCMLCAMFALLLEQREHLERALPRVQAVATCLTAFFCTVFGISNVIAFIGGAFSSVLYLIFDAAILTLAVYFDAKAASYLLPHPTDKESEVEV